MIKKIDIQKFGLFSDYNWNSEIGSDPKDDNFKKVNIIYGRNYSGKTTLSRIFRCIEMQKLHKDYLDSKFTLSTDDDSSIDESNLNYSKKIRVYNSDFVKENLSWLHNENGEILPFALLGGDNTIIEGKIKEIEEQLGVLDKGTNSYKEGTLYFEKNKKKIIKDDVNQKCTKLNEDLINRLTQKANKDIKTNPHFVKQGTNYNITSIRTEIADILDNSVNCTLSDEEITKLKATISEERKDSVSQLPPLKLSFPDYITISKGLVSKEITLSNALKELVEDDLLQAWVNNGRNLHKDSNTCAFCGNAITPERRKQLDEHFSKESKELEASIKITLEQFNSIRQAIDNHLYNNKIEKNKFYTILQTKYDDIINEWNRAIASQHEQISFLEEKLKERLKNLFKPITNIDFSQIEANPIDLNLIVNEFNALIDENEEKSKSIEKDKNNARNSLRYQTIKSYLDDIEYTFLVQAINEAEVNAKSSSNSYDELKETILSLETDKINLEKELKDEGRAAEKINKHLIDFFGHDGLKLEPYETHNNDEVKTRFIIKRGEVEAKNLSEGECSLIAFCYFIAKIEDELQDPNAKDNLIIYIDDPISSLDNNHIFFVFGIINTVIVSANKIENVRFNQLFISTHNLEFLKYLHRLSPFSGLYLKDSNPNMNHFLIEKRRRKDDTKGILRLMPKHLRLSTTEYIYLFKQIYNMAKPYDNIDDKIKDYEENYTLLYNIGNNMRRFMESYLSFKYAGENDPLYLLNDFFSDIIGSQLNRASNEYSHLSWLEKGSSLLDIPEAERLSILILKGLKNSDQTHYNALCKKIEVDPI